MALPEVNNWPFFFANIVRRYTFCQDNAGHIYQESVSRIWLVDCPGVDRR
jgi:hypothetical protein